MKKTGLCFVITLLSLGAWPSLGSDLGSDLSRDLARELASAGAPVSAPLGDLEAKYAATGPCETAATTVTGYRIFHPREMKGAHPVIAWGNGTGAPTFCYSVLLGHLASWGFVVISPDSVMTGSGKEMLVGVDYLQEQHKTEGSPFFGKLDIKKIGSTGHSQGGGGAINAATDPRVTCCAPLAPAPGKIREVKGPVFLIAGAKDSACSPEMVRRLCYEPSQVPTVYAVQKDMDHLQFAWNGGGARGYLTAWFMHHLQNDAQAGQAFAGQGELFANVNWAAEKKN